MITFYTWCWYYHLSSRQKNPKNPDFRGFHLIPARSLVACRRAPASRAQGNTLSLRDSCSRSTCCAWPLRMPSGEQQLARSLAQLLRSCVRRRIAGQFASLTNPVNPRRIAREGAGNAPLRPPELRYAQPPGARFAFLITQIAQNLANARPLGRSAAL